MLSFGDAKTRDKTPASRPSLTSTLFLPSTRFFSLQKKDAEVKIQQAGDKGRGHSPNLVFKMH